MTGQSNKGDGVARRQFVAGVAGAASALLFCTRGRAAAPEGVSEVWADFDPQKEPLETELIREWREAGGVYRYVRFLVGTFNGTPARMAAFYGFPERATAKLPAVMHMHGGGQRAFMEEVRTYVARGFAALSVNWGGREMEDARPGDLNTDWGAVDPTQQNVPGYFSQKPGPKQFYHDREHAKNCNWYVLTLGCRRGITFLERQAEVDADRIGIFGHSMGGNLTMYVAGTDARVRAAAPSVGGAGWRTERHAFGGGTAVQDWITGDAAAFARTMGFENYAPRIRCPVMHLSGTNDFHGWMDDVYRTNALIPDQPTRFSFAPHLNHRFIPEVAVTRPLWLEQYLKDGPAVPRTPESRCVLNPGDGTPVLRVTPEPGEWPVGRVEIYYSVDSDPRARFWRSTDVARTAGGWEAKLPPTDAGAPLFAFANVYFRLPAKQELPHMPAIGEVCVSSMMHAASAEQLAAAGVRATDRPTTLIEDFAHGWRDWYRLNADNRNYWQFWTRKVTDPKWRAPRGAKLAVTVRLEQANRIFFVLEQNEWRNYRGPRRTFVCVKQVRGSPVDQEILLVPGDLRTADGAALADWVELDQLGLTATREAKPGEQPPPANWRGPMPEFLRVEWKV